MQRQVSRAFIIGRSFLISSKRPVFIPFKRCFNFPNKNGFRFYSTEESISNDELKPLSLEEKKKLANEMYNLLCSDKLEEVKKVLLDWYENSFVKLEEQGKLEQDQDNMRFNAALLSYLGQSLHTLTPCDKNLTLTVLKKSFDLFNKVEKRNPGLEYNTAICLGTRAADMQLHEISGQALERALHFDENNKDLLYGTAFAYRQCNYEKAKQFYEILLEKFGDDASVVGDVAGFYKEFRKADRAEELFKKALEMDPVHPNNLANYATFLLDDKNDPKKAEEIYRKVLKLDPKHPIALVNLGSLCVARGSYEEGRSFYMKALQTPDLDDISIIMNVGFVEHMLGNYDTAWSTFQYFFEMKERIRVPDHPLMFLTFGNLCLDMKKYNDAEEAYRRGLRADPTHSGLLGNYAYFLETVKNDYEYAEHYYKKSIQNTNDKECIQNLANYANFLEKIKRDIDGAQQQYDKLFSLLQEDDEGAHTFYLQYANFCKKVKKDITEANKYFALAQKKPKRDRGPNMGKMKRTNKGM